MNDNLRQRISDASDDNLELHAAYKTGSDADYVFYVVVGQKEYEGKDILKMAYFAAHHTQPDNDTWMSNGLRAREGTSLLDALARDLQHAHNGITGDDGDFISRDLTSEE